MKKYVLLFILVVLVIPFSIFAEEKTLFGDKIEHGGYGGPVVKFMSLGGDLGVLVGGRGGWIINHMFVIGGGGYGLASDTTINGNDLQLDYGGFEVEYIWRSDSILHFTVHTGRAFEKMKEERRKLRPKSTHVIKNIIEELKLDIPRIFQKMNKIDKKIIFDEKQRNILPLLNLGKEAKNE